MESEKIIRLLKKHQLRITDCRQKTLALFSENTFALSQPDIERNLDESFDRVTIYRTLGSFMDSGLVHKVLDDTGVAKYALCRDDCETHAHHDEHIHFKCERCGNTSCLDGMPFPDFSAPEGFTFTETNILINGICKACGKAALA